MPTPEDVLNDEDDGDWDLPPDFTEQLTEAFNEARREAIRSVKSSEQAERDN